MVELGRSPQGGVELCNKSHAVKSNINLKSREIVDEENREKFRALAHSWRACPRELKARLVGFYSE